jgi:hypothetical protein
MLKGNFMQQRRLRLGDILDDYCPRERRVTNHAVVAIVGEDVKQTRCTTCDVDHEYRHGKAPTPRRTKATGVLGSDQAEDSRPVLAKAAVPQPRTQDAPEHDVLDHDAPELAVPAHPVAALPDFDQAPPPAMEAAPADTPATAADAAPSETSEDHARDDDGPVHRRLIRATFPRPEGHVPERREPEFTVRQHSGRGRGGDIDGNSTGYRSRGSQYGQGGGHGGGRGFGGRQSGGGGFGYDQRNSGRGPGGRGGNRQGGGGGGNRGPRHGGAGRKGR